MASNFQPGGTLNQIDIENIVNRMGSTGNVRNNADTFTRNDTKSKSDYDLINLVNNAKGILALGAAAEQASKRVEELEKLQQEFASKLGANSKATSEATDKIIQQLNEADDEAKRLNALKEQAEKLVDQETLEAAKNLESLNQRLKEQKNIHEQNIENLEAENALLAEKGDLTKEERKKYRENQREIEANTRALAKLNREGLSANKPDILSAEDRATGNGGISKMFNAAQDIRQAMTDPSLDGLDLLKEVLKAVNGIREGLRNTVESAAQQLNSYYSRIVSGLDGTQISFETIAENSSSNMGLSMLVKQTDYLTQIASLTDQGLNQNIEERALLATISDKALKSFDANNDTLNRLVRLKQQDVISSQFGLEYVLRRTLNSVFNDSQYLTRMYDSVASAIVDAGVASRSDITNFNSTVQTWLGYMYESGLSENVISKIASGINYLGSGNVSALASDQDVQRLFLLSMDRIGMDYAETLQTGLSSSDTNKLMSSIVQYLAEISDHTADNLVLKSSYSNLFNMTTSDIQAIKNLSEKATSITGVVNTSSAIGITQQVVSNLSQRLTASEMFNNLVENAQYTFGAQTAQDSKAYAIYKTADLLYGLFDSFSGVGGAIGTIAKAGMAMTAITEFVDVGLGGLIGIVNSIGSLTNAGGSLSGYIVNDVGAAAGISGVSSQAANIKITNAMASSTGGASPFKTVSTAATEYMNSAYQNTETTRYTDESGQWIAQDEDIISPILQKFEKTMMGLEGGEHNAIAVSLEGLNDNVLKSFASIFADEDAMLETFTGDNTVITEHLFKFTDNTTSNTASSPATETSNS